MLEHAVVVLLHLGELTVQRVQAPDTGPAGNPASAHSLNALAGGYDAVRIPAFISAPLSPGRQR
jgi:hypothetical protein